MNSKELAQQLVSSWNIENHGESMSSRAEENTRSDGTHPDDELCIYRSDAEKLVEVAMHQWTSLCLGGDSIPKDLDPRIKIVKSKCDTYWNWELVSGGMSTGPFKSAGWATSDGMWYLQWRDQHDKLKKLKTVLDTIIGHNNRTSITACEIDDLAKKARNEFCGGLGQ